MVGRTTPTVVAILVNDPIPPLARKGPHSGPYFFSPCVTFAFSAPAS